MLAGDARAIARAISLVEDEAPEAAALVARIYQQTGRAYLVGITGAPGTGKSTVALYRVRVLISALRKEGVAKPRILFTTYTNALVRFSEQLLGQLLGDDAALVTVRTADSIAVGVLRATGAWPAFCQGEELDRMLERAVGEARLEGNSLAQAAQRQTIERLERGYLLEEIAGVIWGRGLTTLEA